jgi:hypothetical protein
MLAGVLVWGLPGVAHAGTLDDVAVKGEDAPPPLAAAFDYALFNFIPAVSDGPAGRKVAFSGRARKPPPSAITKNCLFADDASGTGKTIACVNDAAPSGRVFRSFSQPSMNAAGDIAWASGLNTDASGFRNGVFTWNGTSVSLVALAGDSAPSGMDGDLVAFPRVVNTGSEGVVFIAQTSAGPVDEGILRCAASSNCHTTPGALETLVTKGDSLPAPHATREICGFHSVAASNWGIAFRASTKEDCSGVEVAKDGVFRMEFGQSLETVALVGDDAEPSGDYASIIESPAIEAAGIVAFQASTTGGVNIIYRCDPSDCPGANLPEDLIASGSLLSSPNPAGHNQKLRFFSSPVLKDGGTVIAFRARVKDLTANDQFDGIFTIDSGAVSMIARTTTAALTPFVTPLGGNTVFQGIFDPSMSPGGNIAFRGTVKQTVTPKTVTEGIFLFTP